MSVQIKVRYGKLYLVVRCTDSNEIIKKVKIIRATELAPIIVLCEDREYYVRGFGIMIESEEHTIYTFQLISLSSYTNPIDILRSFGFRAIIDYDVYGKVLGIVRGWKVYGNQSQLKFASGVKYSGTGVLYKELEWEYDEPDGIYVPVYVDPPRGWEHELRYPSYLQRVPAKPYYEYGFEVKPDEELVEVENVTIPGFALI